MTKYLSVIIALLLATGTVAAQIIIEADDVDKLPTERIITIEPKPMHPVVDAQVHTGSTPPIHKSLQAVSLPVTQQRFFGEPASSKPHSAISRAQIEGLMTFRTPVLKQSEYVKGELCIEFWDIARGKLNIQMIGDNVITGIPEIDVLNAFYKTTEMPRLVSDADLPPMALEYRLDLMFLIKMNPGLDMEAVAAEYRTMPMVKCAHPNYIPYPANVTRTYPNDTLFDWAPNITQGPAAWSVTYGTNTDTIGIIDVEMFNNTHADLNNNYANVYGGTSTLGTSSWHGTGCASHACAEINNTSGISGAAGGWGTTKGILWMPYRINSTASNVTAVSWMVTNGACIISQSALYLSNPEILEDAYANALANNVLSFAAAGNDNNYYANNMWPAYFNSVVAVGGIDPFGRHWAWDDSSGSCYGDWVDITAPGDAHWTCNATSYVGGYGGTSWATPRAAAIAALVVNYRGLRGMALKEVVERTADENDYLNASLYSYGAQPYGLTGSGRVNAYEAVMYQDRNVSVNWIALSSNFNPYANPYNLYVNYDAADTIYGKHVRSLVPYVPIKPRAMVQNRGIAPASFNVTAASTGYTSTKTVAGLAPSSAEVVEFDPFTPGTSSSYTISIYTALNGDQNTKNDTFSYVFPCSYSDTIQKDPGDWTVTYTDVWAAWAVSFEPERQCTLKAIQVWLSDSGTGASTNACSICVWENKQGKPGARLYTYRLTATNLPDGGIWRNLSLGTAQVIRKPVFIGLKTRGGTGIAHTRPAVERRWEKSGDFWYSSTGLPTATDWGTMNDLLLRPIVSYCTAFSNDAAVMQIDAPDPSVVRNTGQLPRVTVANYSNAAKTFNVTCRIDSSGINVYSSTKPVSSLAPASKYQVIFDPWIVGSGSSTYNMQVYTQLASDQVALNDTAKLDMAGSFTATLTYCGSAAVYFSDVNAYWAVKFNPIAACSIIGGNCMVYDPNATGAAETLYTWAGGTDPGTAIGGPVTFSGTYYPTWAQPDFPTPIYTTGEFWLGYWTAGDPNGPWVLADAGTSNDRNKVGDSPSGPWYGPITRNLLIEARVKYLSSPARDLGVATIDAPGAAAKIDVATIPKATIVNNGQQTINNFNVRCIFDTVGVAVYTSTKAVATLRPTETAQVSFDPWTPDSLGLDYRQRVRILVVPPDNNLANDSLIDSVNCSNLDVISYCGNPYFYFGPMGDTSYCAQRFTPELPCSLVGYWIALRDSTASWSNECTTFVWNNRGDGREWPRSQQLTPWFEAWTPVPSNPAAYGAWLRRTISPKIHYNMNQDFWIGFKDPNGTGAARFPAMYLDSRCDYGRSFWDTARDSTWWYPLTGDWCLQALVEYYGGESHILRGNVINTSAQDSLHFRSYLAKNPEQLIDDINSSEASISQIEASKALWQVDCRYFWPAWTHRDRVFTIVDWEENSGTSGHKGYYAAIIDTLLAAVDPQDAPACTLRAIPKPAYNVISWTASRKILNIHWNPPKKDVGKPDTTYVAGYNVYRSLDDAVNLPFRKTMGTGINDTIFTDTLYPPWGTHYYAIKLLHVGHTFGKDPATIESRYLSENLPVNTIGIEEKQVQDLLPTVFALEAPRPNPFIKHSVIKYAVPRTSHVKINLYDATGRLAMTVVDKQVRPGYYEFRLDERIIASGVYFCKMNAGEFEAVKKLILVR